MLVIEIENLLYLNLYLNAFHCVMSCIQVGDDVVFGSRSVVLTSTAVRSAKVVFESGAMVADRLAWYEDSASIHFNPVPSPLNQFPLLPRQPTHLIYSALPLPFSPVPTFSYFVDPTNISNQSSPMTHPQTPIHTPHLSLTHPSPYHILHSSQMRCVTRSGSQEGVGSGVRVTRSWRLQHGCGQRVGKSLHY